MCPRIIGKIIFAGILPVSDNKGVSGRVWDDVAPNLCPMATIMVAIPHCQDEWVVIVGQSFALIGEDQ